MARRPSHPIPHHRHIALLERAVARQYPGRGRAWDLMVAGLLRDHALEGRGFSRHYSVICDSCARSGRFHSTAMAAVMEILTRHPECNSIHVWKTEWTESDSNSTAGANANLPTFAVLGSFTSGRGSK